MCAAAAGGVLTSLGIATIGIEPWFVPVVAILLVIGLWGFWQSARAHGKWRWFLLAIAGAAMTLGGRLLELAPVLWIGTILLVIAYTLDLRDKRKVLSVGQTSKNL